MAVLRARCNVRSMFPACCRLPRPSKPGERGLPTTATAYRTTTILIVRTSFTVNSLMKYAPAATRAPSRP